MIADVIQLSHMTTNPFSPPSADQSVARGVTNVSKRFRAIAGLLIAVVAGIIAAPMAFAFLWALGDYAAGNIPSLASANGMVVLLVLGTLLSSLASSHLMGAYWPIATILTIGPTVAWIGGIASNNSFSSGTIAPLLAVVIPAVTGGVVAALINNRKMSDSASNNAG